MTATLRNFHVIMAATREIEAVDQADGVPNIDKDDGHLWGGIGKDGGIPWDIKEDRGRFSKITKGTPPPGMRNFCISGLVTYLSYPESFRPLPGRVNVIITSHPEKISLDKRPEDILIFASFDEAHMALSDREDVHEIFVCGGAKIYDIAISSPHCENVYMTWVTGKDFGCDTIVTTVGHLLFPLFYSKVSEDPVKEHDDGFKYWYATYTRARFSTH